MKSDSRNPFEATSPSDLTSKLHSWDVCVPRRGEGRTKHHTERWVTCRFLDTISNTELLSYPLCVKPDDRPDLVLELKLQNHRQIGIEITEAVYSTWANIDARCHQNDPILVPEIKIDDPHWPKHKIDDYVKCRGQNSLPIMGDAMIRNWYNAIYFFVNKKARKFKKPGFKKYPNNWLLVHDNLSASPPDWEIKEVSNKLGQDLYTSDWENPFDKIFILSSKMVLEFGRQSEPIAYPVTFRSNCRKT